MKVSTKRRVIPLCKVFKGGGEYTPFPEFFNEDFCDVVLRCYSHCQTLNLSQRLAECCFNLPAQ